VSEPGLGGRDKSTRRGISISANTAQVIAAVITGLFVLGAAFVTGAFAGPRINLFVAAQPTVTITATVRQAATPQVSNVGGSGTQTGQVLFQKKGVLLTEGYQLSFTDPTLHPFPSNAGYCGSGDLYVSTCAANVYSSAQLAVYDGKAGFSQCQADTAYVTGSANATQKLLTGTTLCVTTGHRIAVCYVTNDTTQAGTPAPGLIMDVTVYATP
jgi:hypothetical protein